MANIGVGNGLAVFLANLQLAALLCYVRLPRTRGLILASPVSPPTGWLRPPSTRRRDGRRPER